jgi:hypothetical protein
MRGVKGYDTSQVGHQTETLARNKEESREFDACSGSTGIAQSLQCLTTDWTTGVRSPAEAKDFSSSPCALTSSEAHPASCPKRIGG